MATPKDIKLYNKIKKEVYSNIPKHSAYRSGILVKEYKVGRDGTHHSIILCTGAIHTTDIISKILSNKFVTLSNGDSDSLFKTPKNPISEKETNYLCWALLACTIGNGYWKGGEASVGATKDRV